MKRYSRRASYGDPLTERELQILAAYAHGESGELVARSLLISYQTLKNHLTGAYIKLGVTNARQAIYAMGWVKIPLGEPTRAIHDDAGVGS